MWHTLIDILISRYNLDNNPHISNFIIMNCNHHYCLLKCHSVVYTYLEIRKQTRHQTACRRAHQSHTKGKQVKPQFSPHGECEFRQNTHLTSNFSKYLSRSPLLGPKWSCSMTQNLKQSIFLHAFVKHVWQQVCPFSI